MAARQKVGTTLVEAQSSLEAGDDETALLTMLNVWRETRAPRLADAIDRVAARVDAARKTKIKGKSVKERTAAWLELAAKKDPLDLGPLLATPWPGTWQPALPVLEALMKFPDDPRVAMALAKVVDETRYETWTSDTFYRPLFARLNKLLDLRALPLLEAQLPREKSYYYKRDMRPMEEAAVAKLRAAYPDGPPSLAKREDAALAAIEARFSGAVRAEQSRTKGEAEFLAEIYANPDDDALRQVFADWLSERGDPRGELIVLQLARAAGQSNDTMKKRESALINKHGEAWAGPLHRFLSKKGRVFERGFLAEAEIELEGDARSVPDGLSDPAFATLRALRCSRENLATAVLELPSMRFLRGLRSIPERVAYAIANGPPRPRIDELEIDTDHDPDLDARAKLFAGDALPSLRTLGLETQDLDELDRLLQTPLARRAERLVLRNYEYPLGPFIASVERHALPAKELVLMERPHLDEWCMTVTRDATGKLTKLRCATLGKLPSPYDLTRALETLEPDALTEFIVEKPKTMWWDRSYITMAETAIARFTRLAKVEVPWERLSTETVEGRAFSLSLHGKGLLTAERLPAVWKLLHAPPFSLGFDGYEVNYSKHSSFGSAPLEEALETLAKKRTSSMRMYRKNAPDLASMGFWTNGKLLELKVPECDVDAFVNLVMQLCDLVHVESGNVPFVLEDEDGDASNVTIDLDPPLERDAPHLGWLTVFGESTAKYFPFAPLTELFSQVGFRAARSKRNLVIVAPSIDEAPDHPTRKNLQIELCGLMWRSYRTHRGYALPELVRQVMGPALEKRGFVEVELGALQRAYGMVFYRNAHETGARGIHFAPRFPTTDGEIDVELRHTRDEPNATLLEDWGRSTDVGNRGLTYNDQLSVADEKQARASLGTIVSRLDTLVIPWFEAPPEKPKKRRR